MPTFLNFTYSNNLVRHSHSNNSSFKDKSYSLIPVNSVSHLNNKTINEYATPFRPRPLKQYRKRLVPNYSASIKHISIDTINSPGGVIKTNMDKTNHPYSKLFNKHKWHNRL